MSEPMVGEIRMFAGNYAPKGWAFCNGQLLSIAQNTMLFSILGPTYGGNGTTTFALPDLRGRVPVGMGMVQGTQEIRLGEQGGEMSHALNVAEMPPHTHPAQAKMNVQSNNGDMDSPIGAYLAGSSAHDKVFSRTANNAMSLDAVQVAVNPAGGGLQHNNMQPYLGINFIIAITGDFPTLD